MNYILCRPWLITLKLWTITCLSSRGQYEIYLVSSLADYIEVVDNNMSFKLGLK